MRYFVVRVLPNWDWEGCDVHEMDQSKGVSPLLNGSCLHDQHVIISHISFSKRKFYIYIDKQRED